ncbi:hypothetical protein SDC9_124803 [bioreactor metagenome]|uniref:Uncharacterized protein n=1 Tax=bioreactor metagenome TaxID=1076179 RepID=A0A645CLN0_9ZZZZ
MIRAIHRAPVGVESGVAGVDGVEQDCLAFARFAVFTVRAHTHAGTAVRVIVEDSHISS